MMVLVASVPHTGTNTLEALLRKAGYEYVRRHTHWKNPGKSPEAAVQRFPHDLRAAPLRNPQESWRSWCTRRTMWPPEAFVRAWERLQEFANGYTPTLVPVDLPPERETALRMLHPDLVYEGERCNEHRKGQRNFTNWKDLSLEQWERIWTLPMIHTRYEFNSSFAE